MVQLQMHPREVRLGHLYKDVTTCLLETLKVHVKHFLYENTASFSGVLHQQYTHVIHQCVGLDPVFIPLYRNTDTSTRGTFHRTKCLRSLVSDNKLFIFVISFLNQFKHLQTHNRGTTSLKIFKIH